MKTEPVVMTLCAVSLVALAFLGAPAAAAQPTGCTVSLQPSAPSPQLVGQRIVWTATAANCGAAPVYQFKVADPADDASRFAIVRDFSLDKAFAWAPMHEGAYKVSGLGQGRLRRHTGDVRGRVGRGELAGDRARRGGHGNAQPAGGALQRAGLRARRHARPLPACRSLRCGMDGHQHAPLPAEPEPQLRRRGYAGQHHLRDGPPRRRRWGRAQETFALHDRSAARDVEHPRLHRPSGARSGRRAGSSRSSTTTSRHGRPPMPSTCWPAT